MKMLHGFIIGLVAGLAMLVILYYFVGYKESLIVKGYKYHFDPNKIPGEEPYLTWIYTFPETYPELKPLQEEILCKSFISFVDTSRFSEAVKQVQDARQQNKQQKLIRQVERRLKYKR